MKCREAHYWLYSFRPNSSWPVDVVGHLQQCPKCQQLQAKLKQIDTGVEKLTSGGGNPTAINQLLARIDQTPQPAPAKSELPTQPWRWARLGAYLIGTAALVMLGWYLGRQTDNVRVVPGEPIEKIKIVTEFRDKIQEKIVQVHSPAERILFATLLKRNARLVQSSQATDRLDTLLDMADDCRQHALKLIEQGPRDALPLTIDLYSQLLRDGVLVQVAQAPADARKALQTAARERLEKMTEVPMAPAVALPRVIVEQREVLQNATKETIERVEKPEVNLPMKPRKGQQAEAMLPAATLVQFALTVSSETDPVVKADLCADYVQRLVPSMNLYLAEDATPHRAEMGQQFGELIHFGVYRPLELANAKELPPPAKTEANRIFESVEETVDSMLKKLEQAPEDVRKGFEKPLAPSRKGNDKNKGKGKGPPPGKGPRDIHGVLKSVDAVNGTITVTGQGKKGDLTYLLSKDVLTQFAGIGKLPTAIEVQLRLSDDRSTVIQVSPRKGRDDGERNQK